MFCLGTRQTIGCRGFRLHGSTQGKPRFAMGLRQFLRAPAAERKCRNRVEHHIMPRQPAQGSGHPLTIRREPAHGVMRSTDQILRFGLHEQAFDVRVDGSLFFGIAQGPCRVIVFVARDLCLRLSGLQMLARIVQSGARLFKRRKGGIA